MDKSIQQRITDLVKPASEGGGTMVLKRHMDFETIFVHNTLSEEKT
jgi:hypothetical protein